MNEDPEPHIYAGIVAYRPDHEKIRVLLHSLSMQVDRIIVFNNGGFNAEEASRLMPSPIMEILGTGENLGIGDALNAIVHLASARGANQLITFDQDSLPPAGMIASLSRELRLLEAAGFKVAAVGPTIIDQRSKAYTFPVFQSGHIWIKKHPISNEEHSPIPTILLITSGMLINVRAFQSIGNFRQEYFIDYVDTEWCLRGISNGFTFFVCPNIPMYHELSSDSPKRFFGRLVLKYASSRRYYVFRNALFLLQEKHCPIYMKLYLSATLVYRFFLYLIIDSNTGDTLRAMLRGLRDGVLHRGGIYPFQASSGAPDMTNVSSKD